MKTTDTSHLSYVDILPRLMLGMGVILMIIWPMLGTVALRNVLIFLGGSIGLWYIVRERASLYQRSALPMLFIVLLLLWIGVHYFFYSQDPGMELALIKSTWLRVLFVCFLGVGSGLYVRDNPAAQKIVWAGFYLFLMAFLLNYIWASSKLGVWTIPFPKPFNFGIYGLKLATIFFGMILFSLCCAVIAYQFSFTKMRSPNTLFVAIAGAALTFFTFVVADTKNGVALGLILMLPLLYIFLSRVKKTFTNISIAAALLVLICLVSYLHLKHHPEWKKLIPTVAMGMQIKAYPNWQEFRCYGLPKLTDGSEAHESIYIRAALATEGFKLMLENPYGYGVVDSFRYLVQADRLGDNYIHLTGTHSGWIDFALDFGIPGLLLTWAAIASAMYYSFKQKSFWPYATRWILAGAFITWIFAEICSHHYIETLFYLIALLAAGNFGQHVNKPKPV